MTIPRAITFLAIWILASVASLTGLVTCSRALALDYDPVCYERCQREACRDACAGRAEGCKPCLEAYDRVCREQCPVKKPQPVGR